MLVMVGLLAYANTFKVAFHLDDYGSIIHNQKIQDLNGFLKSFSLKEDRYLTYLTFALNYAVHGLEVTGYHVVNMVVHIVASILVWRVVVLLMQSPYFKKKKISKEAELVGWLVGLIFLTHPIQTQSVTYIVQRLASMAGMFYMAGVYFYLKARLEGLGKKRWYVVGGYFLLTLVMAVLGI